MPNCAHGWQTTVRVRVDEANYRYDLSDVPPNILEVLAASGVCLSELELRLMQEDPVYG